MRLLYFGILKLGSTALWRMRAIEDLGHEVQAFDTSPFHAMGGRLERSVTFRLSWGRAVMRLNKEAVSFARGRRCDWVWIDKGVWMYPQTLESLRKETGGVMVHYTPDPAICFHRTRHFMRGLPLYDVLITSKRFELDAYREHGARRLICLPQGFNRDLFRPRSLSECERQALGSDVCFIGHPEDHYSHCIKVAAEITDKVAVWGARWTRRLGREPWLKRVLRGGAIYEEEYAKALCAAKVALGLMSKWIPETSTTRTYEIPACGTFMLGERTDEHCELYREGVEAEFFGSDDELKEKLRYYLAHDDQRRRIASAGRERCLSSGYSYHDRMRQCLERIQWEMGSAARRGDSSCSCAS